MSLDPTTALVMFAALVIVLFALGFVFTGGRRTSAAMGGATQFAATRAASSFGWAVILLVILLVLGVFGILFGYR